MGDRTDRALAGPWRCPSCGESAEGAYCQGCGERRASARDLELRGLLEPALEAVLQYDGRLWRTPRALLGQPGRLTAAWRAGERRAFLPPFQLFVLANVVFFLAQSATGLNLLSHRLSNLAASDATAGLVAWRLDEPHSDVARFAPRFDQLTETQAKSLVILMAPALALVLAAILRRRPGGLHLVFSLHFFAYALLAFSALFAVLRLLLQFGRSAGWAAAPSALDSAVTGVELAICGAYLWPALRRAYGLLSPRRWATGAVLLLAVSAIFRGYQLVLALLTLFTA